MSAVFQEILSRTRAAVEQYDMLPAGAHVAVGVSGGKDSLVLLLALSQLRRILGHRFKLTAITLFLNNVKHSHNFILLNRLYRKNMAKFLPL